MPNLSSLAAELQGNRRVQQLTVEDLAKTTGLSAGTLRAYEQGRRKPSQEALRKLGEALRVDFESYMVLLAPFAGGHIRRTDSEENLLRLQTIDVLMNLDIEMLRSVHKLLTAYERDI